MKHNSTKKHLEFPKNNVIEEFFGCYNAKKYGSKVLGLCFVLGLFLVFLLNHNAK